MLGKIHQAFDCQFSTDSQEKDTEPAGIKKIRTTESAVKQQTVNTQDKSKQHSCKTGHLSKLTERKYNFSLKLTSPFLSWVTIQFILSNLCNSTGHLFTHYDVS